MAKKSSKKAYFNAAEQAEAFGQSFVDTYEAFRAAYTAFKNDPRYQAAWADYQAASKPLAAKLSSMVKDAWELPSGEQAVVGWGYAGSCSIVIETVATKAKGSNNTADKMAALGVKAKPAPETKDEPETETTPETKPAKKSGKK